MLRRARSQWLLLLGCLLTVLVVGCVTGTEVKSLPPAPSPDKMDMTRFTTLPGTKLPPFQVNVTDHTRVQRLYQAIQALPKFPANTVIHCPVDDGVKYHLDFFQGNTALIQATLDASGCRALHLTTSDVRRTNDAFFSLLAKEIGVSPSSLLVTPQTTP